MRDEWQGLAGGAEVSALCCGCLVPGEPDEVELGFNAVGALDCGVLLIIWDLSPFVKESGEDADCAPREGTTTFPPVDLLYPPPNPDNAPFPTRRRRCKG